MLKLTNIKKTFEAGTTNEKKVLHKINFELNENDFVAVIGGNGAGKSTLLNIIAGVHFADSGKIQIDGLDVTKDPEYVRAKYISRVFQDPRMGTATHMTIEENLAMAIRRGKRRTLRIGISNGERKIFAEHLRPLNLGLENRLKSKVGLLSGGQRQVLTLLMATILKPRLLLLDEHTAALDPKTAKTVLDLTQKIVADDKITTLMVTHNMKDAVKIGNRIVMMDKGDIILNVNKKDNPDIEVKDLLQMFEKASGDGVLSDRMLLT